MATAVQIQVTLDANGAVTGVKQLSGAFDDLGNRMPPVRKKGEDSFGAIESAEKKAHIAGTLWARFTGTEMPAVLEKLAARSKTLGPILAGAFNAGVIVAAGVAVVGVIGNIVTWAKELGGATAELTRMKEAAVAANLASIANPQTLAVAQQHIVLQTGVVSKMQQEADLWRDSNQLAKAYAHTLAFLGDEESQQLVDSEKRLNQNNDALLNLNSNTVALIRSVRSARLEAQSQTDEAGKTGFALIQQQHIDEDKMARNSFDLQSGLSDALTSKLRANAAKAAAATKDLNRDITQETVTLASQTAEMQLQGDAKITESINNRITAERVAFMKKTGMTAAQLDNDAQYQYRVNLITQQGEHDRLEMHRQTLEKIKELESEAAVASLPEWQRGRAQILADEEKTTRELQHELDTRLINKEEFDRLTVASTMLANAKMRDENKRLTEELGSDLQSVFDDITSGNIGKRILANMEKLFFQIVAQWILSLGVMKSAAGSIFGSIIFGPGTTGSNVFGGGSLLGGLLGGGSSSQSGLAPAGVSGSFGSSAGAFSTAGLTLPGLSAGTGLAGATAGIGAAPGSNGLFSASSALTSQTFADINTSHEAGHSTSAASAGSSARGGLFSANGLLGGLGPLAFALAGSKGGKVGTAGGLLGGLLLSGQLAPVLSFLYGAIGLTGTAALLGGGIGGALGFGLGQNFGKGVGILSGAGSGALAGFLIGGPVGALVGGLIGALGGLFGGLFGGSKRKKQANSLADNTILPGITQVTQGFDSFQVDSSSAIQQLEQLRTDAEKQLKALKGEGTSVLNSRIEPAINDAEKHIRDTQGERDRRSSTVFGPPQFDTGGMFSIMRGNAGLAVLHDGEFVMTPAATKKNLAKLQSMNAGGTGGGVSFGDLHIHPTRLDRDYVKDPNGFRKDMLDVLDQARREGVI
jgi:hypothetical protein